MIHYTCDRCKRVIDLENELRYSVHVEVRAVFGNGDVAMDDDADNLLELNEILERLEDEECPDISDEVYRRQRYDLCCECHRQFTRNPLGREPMVSIGFSQN
jgi:hypothetical protein